MQKTIKTLLKFPIKCIVCLIVILGFTLVVAPICFVVDLFLFFGNGEELKFSGKMTDVFSCIIDEVYFW